MVTMINKIEELESVITSLSEKFADADRIAMKNDFLKVLIKHRIEINKHNGVGTIINGVFHSADTIYEFDNNDILIYTKIDHKCHCIGLIHYEDVRTWS